MPFITSFSKDPIRDLSNKFDQFQRQKSEDEARQALRNEALYGLRLPGLMGIGMNQVPNPYSNDRLGDLQAQARANKTRNDRLRDDIGSISYDMLNFPDEYLLRTPEKRSQMANKTRQSANNVMAGLGLLASLGVPAAMGAGMLTRGLTGAALNTGLSVPIYRADPESADPLLDAAMGAGIGMAGLPGMILGGLLGYTPEIDADQEIPRYAGGGIVKGGLNRLAKYFKDEELTRKGVADIIKEKGGNWAPGTIDQGLSSLLKLEVPRNLAITPEGWRVTPEFGRPMTREELEEELSYPIWGRRRAINKFIEGPLSRYIKRDMGTMGDPIRALAEEGITHFSLPRANLPPVDWRFMEGYNPRGEARSRPAKNWEDHSDNAIRSTPVRIQLETADLEDPSNAWMLKADPEDRVNELIHPRNLASNLGFDHMIDELTNAMDPSSGLPRELQLTEDQLNQMGIDRAVRHVDKINKWRTKEMEAAKIADMEGMPVIKEYPEGFKWVELRHPQIGEDDEAGRAAFDTTRKWLKDEGNAMGHCVGGYCEDVAKGRSKIYSLRDAKGQPHVTIEVTPGAHAAFEDYIQERPLKGISSVIKQIKGKQNAAPVKDYLPFVQDFVKTQGPWSDIYELGNAGLRRSSDAFNRLERETLRKAGHEIGDYLTHEEIQKLHDSWPGPRKFAAGGMVTGSMKRLAKRMSDEPTRAGIADIIKESGGNWLGGRVEKSLDSLKQPYIPNPTPEQIGYPLGSAEAERELLENTREGALNRWIEGPLTKYVKRDLATPKDPVRALAEQGILHYAPELELSQYLTQMRDKQGFPAWGVGKSQLASAWEARADRSIHPTRARGYQTDTRDLNENPWLEKLAPNDPVYLPTGGSSFPANLGFDHLTDELRNALNPESGLPRSLLLTPEDMKQMGIDRAVRHVDKINKYRAKEMERAALADMEGMPVIKEYPEGFKWVELKAPQLPQDKIRSVQTPFGWRIEDQFVTPRFKGDPLMYKTEEEARAAHAARGDEERLSRWLKQEGDLMGHCVGGYCEDVVEGRSRIFSLRDSKGQPHVTIETTPSKSMLSGEELMRMDPTIDWDNDVVANQGHFDLHKWVKENRPDLLNRITSQNIHQIKGKANRAPIDEYLPFVQDFVKTQGPWNFTYDLRNAGLRQVGDQYYTLDELRKLHKQPERPDWLEINNILQSEIDDGTPRFAEGGMVSNPAHEDLLRIMEQHKPDLNNLLSGTGVKFATGGIVRSPEILKISNECGGKYGSE